MKIILLSGGSGKRLWPLSNNQRSKQFMKVLKHNNELESMVQRVWRQLGSVGLSGNAYIATGKNQKNMLLDQLDISEEKIITEPSRRDTFPAISLACTYLYSEKKVCVDETIIVLPVDSFVNNNFFEHLIDLERVIQISKSSLGLIGINPTYPSEKYGYLIPKNGHSNLVKHFIEKPKQHIAKELIENGALWNSGVFGFQLKTIIDLLEEKQIPTDYIILSKQYDKLPSASFDYEFSEKQNLISFIEYHGYWKDLGTWNTLTEEMDTRTVGGNTELLDVSNTHVINELNIPIAVIGVENLVIAAGPDGILISTKSDSPRIKELSPEFFEQSD